MKSLFKKGFVVLALVIPFLIASGPARAQQTFSLADFSGEWYWFVLGGYDE